MPPEDALTNSNTIRDGTYAGLSGARSAPPVNAQSKCPLFRQHENVPCCAMVGWLWVTASGAGALNSESGARRYPQPCARRGSASTVVEGGNLASPAIMASMVFSSSTEVGTAQEP